ncbi:MAG: MFS transporter [Rhodocyclaceae bacterium]|nr:MFS transporter [Rhodocyclaceae bacterium]
MSQEGAAGGGTGAMAGRQAEVAAMFARHGPSYRTWAVVTVMLGTVSAVMEATIVNVALPEIIRAFDLGHDRVQLLSTGFLAATTASMLLSHWALRRFGLRRAYMGAVALLMACSVAAAAAPNFMLLAACRIGQGIIAGMVQPLAMVAITDVFPREARGRAMSAYGLGIVLSPAVGPAAGGLLVDHFGWRGVFLVTVPLCLAALALAPRYVVRGREGGAATLDLPGLGLLSAALVMGLGGLAALYEEPRAALVALVAGLLFAVAFVAWQRIAPRPLLDLRLLRHGGFGAALAVATAYGMGIYGSTYLAPLFARSVAGYSGLEAGLMLVPGGVMLAVVLVLAGRLADRLPTYRVAIAGLVCFAASALLMGLVPAGIGFWWLAAIVTLGRVGLGFIIPGLNAGALRLLPHGHEAGGSAAINFFRQLGGALGVTLLALFVEGRQRAFVLAHPGDAAGRATAGIAEGFLLIALVYALAVFAARRMAPRTA